jgi:HAD superfamily hydrolase (TIGR01509 family)
MRKYLPCARPLTGVRELFTTLKQRGYRLGIATTCTGDDLNSYDETMRVLDLADAVTCGEEAAKGKPHPELFYAALHKLRVTETGRVLVVGDTPYDALGAKPLGMHAMGVATGGFPEADLMTAGCDAVVAEVTDLARYLA